ncbi:unnamed protein product [Ambrosiozyma monospora]|uniref:Unnamed protein product n=1 Tax=Ambrosiozyma monospora TaxID=43982 RepID=A0ACB5U6A9_AMBMO|nr:unnamed protein product [Ambrosiozyma monospora]
MTSLKLLVLYNCQLDSQFFNHLPPYLESLHLYHLKMLETSLNGIILPIHLRVLSVMGTGFNTLELPVISNGKILDQLQTVNIGSNTYGPVPKISKLQAFLSSLPSNVNNISLHVNELPEFPNSGNNYLTKLPHGVKNLSLNVNKKNSNLDFSNLNPCLEHFRLSGLSSYSGQLPVTLEQLNIDLTPYALSFSDFWQKFLTNSPRIKKLHFIFKCAGTIDFRTLKFPENLFVLSIDVYVDTSSNMILNTFPGCLTFFGINAFGGYDGGPRFRIDVDESKGITIESLQNKLCLLQPTSFEWFKLS